MHSVDLALGLDLFRPNVGLYVELGEHQKHEGAGRTYDIDDTPRRRAVWLEIGVHGVQEHQEELHQLAQGKVLLPPEALLHILALRRGVVVAVHDDVHQNIEHADQEDMATKTVESDQHVRGEDHEDVMEHMEERDLALLLAQHKEYGVHQVEHLVQMVHVRQCPFRGL